MEKLKNSFKSIRMKLFVTICAVILFIIVFLIIVNNMVLETFYIYSKTKVIKDLYFKINDYYNSDNESINIEDELKSSAIKNNVDILIKEGADSTVIATNKEFLNIGNSINIISIMNKKSGSIMYSKNNITIKKLKDDRTGINYIVLVGLLDNNYKLYIRIPISAIQESVKISNNLLIFIGGIVIFISGIIASVISKRFTKPILELSDIANKMAKLDFSQKYKTDYTDNEINELGKSINTMSQKLETTIKQLRENNNELAKDIEEKSKIDEMRKQFISDVSHELKTPISLIQGYSEGLLENVNEDEESRKFYAEVILDETNKMDKLVRQLLDLMKLEYGKREFNNKKFNINELIYEVLKRCNVMIKENNINLEVNSGDEVYVCADDFYIEQVITNYLINAIKNVQEIQNQKKIIINVSEDVILNNVRVSIFNTGDKIPDEEIDKIWGRFYKLDTSRNRDNGGSGIGLSLVKAIMVNYGEKYGCINKENGVEFYFEIPQK